MVCTTNEDDSGTDNSGSLSAVFLNVWHDIYSPTCNYQTQYISVKQTVKPGISPPQKRAAKQFFRETGNNRKDYSTDRNLFIFISFPPLSHINILPLLIELFDRQNIRQSK